jgi:hypothetical protein
MIDSINRAFLGPTTIIAHDAGAAFYLAKIVKRVKDHSQIFLVLDGPARTIFNKEFSMKEMDRFRGCNKVWNPILEDSQLVITGSGWSSNLEIDAIERAKELGKTSFCLLDHWVNFRRRQTRENHLTLPDEFWVVDEVALKNAREEFNQERVKIRQIDDPVISDLKMLEMKVREKKQLLYVTEPIANFGLMNHLISDSLVTEEQVFAEFAKAVKKHAWQGQIFVRVHPSEKKEMYQEFIKKFSLDAEVSRQPNPLLEILSSEIIVGIESVMLAWAAKIGKKTFTMLPINNRFCSLPNFGI